MWIQLLADSIREKRTRTTTVDLSVESVFLDLILNQYTGPNEISCWPGCKSSHGIGSCTVTPAIKVMVFPAVMYGCESWTINKAEHQRVDAFELWCWRRLLRVPWTARRPNQSILKEISPEYSLEGLMLILLHFGHLMRITDSLEMTLMLGKIEGREEGDDRG